MKKTSNSNRPSIYQTVTDRIISSLKAEVIPWEKPWNTPRFAGGPFPRNFYTLGNHPKAAIDYHLKTGHRETA